MRRARWIRLRKNFQDHIRRDAFGLALKYLKLPKLAETFLEISDGFIGAFQSLEQVLLIESDSLFTTFTSEGVISLYPSDRLCGLMSAIRAWYV